MGGSFGIRLVAEQDPASEREREREKFKMQIAQRLLRAPREERESFGMQDLLFPNVTSFIP